MKIFFKQNYSLSFPIETEPGTLNVKEALQKTREALEVAYTGFDNALENDLIDSYIYEINALQIRYQHLSEMAGNTPAPALRKHSAIRALVSHVFS